MKYLHTPWVKIGGSVFLLGLVLWFVPIFQVLAAARQLSLFTWLILIALSLLGLLVGAFKWNLFLPGKPVSILFKFSLIGQWYTLALPSQILGEAAKAYRLGLHTGEMAPVSMSILADKLSGVVGLVSVALGGLLLTPLILPTSFFWVSVLMLIVIVGIALIIFSGHGYRLLLRVIQFFEHTVNWSGFVATLEGLYTASHQYTNHKVIGTALTLSVLQQLVYVYMNMQLGAALSIHIGFVDWCWVFGLSSILLLLPITIAGIGLRESVLISLLALLGVDKVPAVAFGLLILSTQVVLGLLGLVMDLLHRETNSSSV